MTALLIEDVSKSFGPITAIENVNLSFDAGELVTFLGPSGCGKTTLLRIIAGLEEQNSGRIVLDGEDITHRAIHKREIGMVFQSFALFPHLNVADNIAYGMRLRGMSKEDCAERVDGLLEMLQLPGSGRKAISQLSGGQKQRVAIARALALRPRLFLLDEPMSALDANLRVDMQIELRRLQQKLGVTTIVVTHDQTEAMTISDRVVVMGEHTVQQVGTPVEIYKAPVSRFVANFIGASNMIPGRLSAPREATLNDQKFEIATIADGVQVGDAVMVMTRPEDIVISPGKSDGAHNRIPGTVSFVRDIGHLVEILVDTAGSELMAVMTPKDCPDIAVGDAVSVHLPPAACLALAH